MTEVAVEGFDAAVNLRELMENAAGFEYSVSRRRLGRMDRVRPRSRGQGSGVRPRSPVNALDAYFRVPVEDSTQREQGRARQGPGFDESPCGLDRELHGRQFDRSRRQALARFIVALPVERSLEIQGRREAPRAEPAGETGCASEQSGDEQHQTGPP